MVRIQVLVDEKERETFRQLAQTQGLSLSGWMRQIALAKAESSAADRKIKTPADLERFFRTRNRRNRGKGREPEWEEHLAVMDRSRSSGQPKT